MREVAEYSLRFEDKPPYIVFKTYFRYFITSIGLFSILALFIALILMGYVPPPTLGLKVPGVIVLALLVGLSTSALATLFTSLIPYFKLKGHFDEIDKEALWLATLTRFFAITGRPATTIFKALINVPFPAIKREARAFLRASTIQGEIAALLRLLSNVPRGAWYHLLTYVEGVALHGQDPVVASELMYDTVEKEYRAYLDRKVIGMNVLVMGATSLFTILPLVMLTIAAVIASSASTPIVFMTTVVNVVIATVLVLISSKTFTEGKLLHRKYATCAPLISIPIVSYILSSQLKAHFSPPIAPLLLFSTTVIALFIAWRIVYPQVRTLDEIFEHTPTFLADVLVHVHQGKDLVTASKDVLSSTSYGESFDEFMKMLITASMVEDFETALSKFKGLIQRSVFTVLYLALQAVRSGNVAAFSATIRALRDYRDTINSLKKKLGVVRIVFLIAVAVSVGMTLYILKFMVPMLTSLSASATPPGQIGISVPFEFIRPEQVPQLVELMCLSLFVNTVVGALVIGSISSLRLAGGIKFALLISVPVALVLSLFMLGVI